MTEIEVYAQSAVVCIPSIILWTLLAVLVVGFALIFSHQKVQRTQKISRLILVEWVVLIFCSTIIFREARTERTISLVPLSSYFCIAENSYLEEVAVINLLNICMFLPVGFLLRCGYRNVTCKKVFLVGLLLSASIEFLQMLLCKGLCEIDDIIHNVAGCMLGYGIGKVITKKLYKYV